MFWAGEAQNWGIGPLNQTMIVSKYSQNNFINYNMLAFVKNTVFKVMQQVY